MKRIILVRIILAVVLLFIGNVCYANELNTETNTEYNFNSKLVNYHLEKVHSDIYVVKDGDTLRSIARQFVTEERIIFEFEEGIVEGNYSVFENRESKGNFSKGVLPGDILIIYNRK